MSDKKEQLQKSPPDAIEEVDERSDEDENAEPKSATAKAKSKASADASKNAKAAPKKKLQKVARGVAAAAALGGGLPSGGKKFDDAEDYITRSQAESLITKAVSDVTDQFTLDNKNLEADKLAFETKLRRAMQDLVAPCVEQGVKHREQFVETIQKLHQHESSIVFLEDVLYKSQTVDNRFDAIDFRFAKMEEQRALDNQAFRNELEAHKNEMDRILHEQELRLSKIDLLMQRCDAAEETCRTTEERLL